MMRVSLSLTQGPGEYIAVVLWFYPPLSFVLPFVFVLQQGEKFGRKGSLTWVT